VNGQVRPFILRTVQQDDIVRPLFGWNGRMRLTRFRRCYVWSRGKNGKTEMAAGIALLMFVGDAEEGGEV